MSGTSAEDHVRWLSAELSDWEIQKTPVERASPEDMLRGTVHPVEIRRQFVHRAEKARVARSEREALDIRADPTRASGPAGRTITGSSPRTCYLCWGGR